MGKTADYLRDAFGHVKNSNYPNSDDCGSEVVSLTVDLFTSELESGLQIQMDRVKEIAGEIGETIKDFSQTETDAELVIQDILNAVQIVL